MNWSRLPRIHDAALPLRGRQTFLRAAEVGDPHRQRPPIVLIHGIFAAGRYMVPLGRLLARQYRVYIPDLPGFGRNRFDDRVYDLGQLGDWLADWHHAMKLPPAVWVGNSLGCQIIARLVARHPNVARAVVLTGPTVDPAHRGWIGQALRMLIDAPRENVALMLIASASALRFGPVRAIRMIQHTLRDQIEDHLPHIPCPALIVRGEHDPLVPRRWAERATSLLPHGRLVVVPSGSHAVNDSAAETVSQIVHNFILSTAPSPPGRGAARSTALQSPAPTPPAKATTAR